MTQNNIPQLMTAPDRHNGRGSLLLTAFCFLCFLLSGALATAQSQSNAQSAPTTNSATQSHYTLTPEEYQKAIAYARARYRLYFADSLYGLLLLVVVIQWRWAVKFRDVAERIVAPRIAQAAIFGCLLVVTLTVLDLPSDIYDHVLALRYNQSVQGWSSWFADWAKGLFIGTVVTIVVVWILYALIRRTPRRWWIYAWLLSIPGAIFLMFITPVVIEPMFFKFVPLEQDHPELVAQIESVVTRAGMDIPPNRMYEMKASEKLNSLNAYVTGFGPSKRVVVWDTTMQKMTTPEVLFVFGHEMGHYVLHHIVKGIVATEALVFFALWSGFYLFRWLLRRYGDRWRIRGQDDWASFAVLLLIFVVFNFLCTPLASGVSRYFEHQADVYGLEVTHAVDPDWSRDATQSFQILGEVSLDDPSPSPFIEFWLYDHPSIDERIRFAASYDPWKNGARGQFVK